MMMKTILKGGIKNSKVFSNVSKSFQNKISFCKSNTFIHFSIKNFNEQMKLKERIQVVDSDNINDEKEDWGEMMALNLEKENYMKFYENMTYIKQKNIILNLQDINKILSMVYNKNIKAVDTIYNYICDRNIQLDSISYNYLITSNLLFKSYHAAFDFFFQASLFNIPQNLSVIIALYKELVFVTNEEDKIKFQNIMETHTKKFYPDDVLELLENLNADLKKEAVEESEVDTKGFSRNRRGKRVKATDEFIKGKKQEEASSANVNNIMDIEKTEGQNEKDAEIKTDYTEADPRVAQSLNESIRINSEGLNTAEGLINFEQNINSTRPAVPHINETILNDAGQPFPPIKSTEKSIRSKKKDKKSKRNSDSGLESLFGSNRGIIVITPSSFMDGESDDDGSHSD